MTLEKFSETIKEEVTKKLLENNNKGISLSIVNKEKDNAPFTCLVIHRNCEIMSPIFNLSDYFKSYNINNVSIESISNSIVNLYYNNTSMKYNSLYDRIKPNIVYMLINTERNKTLLNDIPHIPFHDLSIVFYNMAYKNFDFSVPKFITNGMIDDWKITTQDLYNIAKENTPKILEPEIVSLYKKLQELAEKELIDIMEQKLFINAVSEELEDEQMFTLSNKENICGASCILYPGVLKNFADKLNSNLFILPSSVNEVILIPATEDEDTEYLKSIVYSVNREDTSLNYDEILSDSVYLYNRETDKIEIL